MLTLLAPAWAAMRATPTNLIEALAAIDSVNDYTLYVTRDEAVEQFSAIAGPTSSFVRLFLTRR